MRPSNGQGGSLEGRCFLCSVADGGPDVHLPMGGVERLGPQVIRAAVAGVQRILYLCQVLHLYKTAQAGVKKELRSFASFDKETW